MREIKFKGKRKDGTEWLIGDLNHIDGKVYIFQRDEGAPLNSPDWFEVEPETVGQFAGLLDKHKQEIYEGDIIKIYNIHYCISWLDKQACYALSRNGYTYDSYPFNTTESYNCIVVGNIYSNTELLNKKP